MAEAVKTTEENKEQESDLIVKLRKEFEEKTKALQKEVADLKAEVNSKNETIAKLVIDGTAPEVKVEKKEEKQLSFEEQLKQKALKHLEDKYKRR